MATACYTLNRVLTVKPSMKTCFELLHRSKPNLKFLEPFGSPCTVIDPDGKFGPKSLEVFFLGYESPLKRVFMPSMRQVVRVQHVDCQKYTIPTQQKGQEWMFKYDDLWKSFDLPQEPSEEEIEALYQHYQAERRKQIQGPIIFNQSSSVTSSSDIAGPSSSTPDNSPSEPVNDQPESPFVDPVNADPEVQYDSDSEESPTFDNNGESSSDEESNQITEMLNQSAERRNQNEASSSNIPAIDLIVDLNINNLSDTVNVPQEEMPRTYTYHPSENIIGELQAGVKTRSQINKALSCFYTKVAPLTEVCFYSCFISQMEPKSVTEALGDDY